MLLKQKDIENYIDLLLENLKNLKDEKLEFVWHLEDGSIYDTKSFNGWEWTQGVALYGIYKYYEQKEYCIFCIKFIICFTAWRTQYKNKY